MLPNKNYLTQIAMIESECEPRKVPNIPAAIFHRSPLRDRQNKNISNNTPSRNTKKISISPYRRRENQVNTNLINTTASSKVHLSRRKAEPDCDSHAGKQAKYMIEGDGQILYYCEKCAIQLASQGFKVEKMLNQSDHNPRKRQLDEFISVIQGVVGQLDKKKVQIDKVISKGEQALKSQMERVEEYYSQFYEIIDEHKSRVLEELSQEYENETKGTKSTLEKVKEAMVESEDMKNEITKLQAEILQTQERQFRPCMNQYVEKMRTFQQLSVQHMNDDFKMKKLSFNDPDEACQTFIKCMNIEWEEEFKEQQQKTMKPMQTENQRSQQSTTRNENPIEFLEKEEKHETNIKTLGNLFASFDQ